MGARISGYYYLTGEGLIVLGQSCDDGPTWNRARQQGEVGRRRWNVESSQSKTRRREGRARTIYAYLIGHGRLFGVNSLHPSRLGTAFGTCTRSAMPKPDTAVFFLSFILEHSSQPPLSQDI